MNLLHSVNSSRPLIVAPGLSDLKYFLYRKPATNIE